MKRLLLAFAVLSCASVASAENWYMIGPRGQYTFGSAYPGYGWSMQNGVYNQYWIRPAYTYPTVQNNVYNYGNIYYAPQYSQRWGF